MHFEVIVCFGQRWLRADNQTRSGNITASSEGQTEIVFIHTRPFGVFRAINKLETRSLNTCTRSNSTK